MVDTFDHFVHIQYVEAYHTADATATHLINFPNWNLLQYKGENLANKIFTGGGGGWLLWFNIICESAIYPDWLEVSAAEMKILTSVNHYVLQKYIIYYLIMSRAQ